MPAKAQAAPSSGDGVITTPDAFNKLLIKMGQIATLDETEKTITGEDIIPILTAETEEEMWDADDRGQYNARKLSGCAIQLISFEVKFGTGDDPSIKTPFIDPATKRQMYLLVHSCRIAETGDEAKDVKLPDIGEVFTWNTSARYIAGKLFWMLNHGWFDTGHSPVYARIEGTALTGGRSIEKLKKLRAGTVVNASAEVPF